MDRPAPHRQHGFTLVEAMIALLVMAFGMLALAGLQVLMARNADVAKQRSEATRLAQQQIEVMRSYTTLTTTAGMLAWADLTTTADDPANPLTSSDSNTSYTRSWTVGGSTADPSRPVSVSVAWTDRAGDAQTVVLNTVIAQSDPFAVGSLGFPLPANTNLKRPRNRNLNIPAPAIDLGNGKSAYQLAANFAIVFSNDSGYVVEKCNTIVNATNYASAGCTAYNAYVVAGYVSGDLAGSGLGINTQNITGASAPISCTYGPAKNQNTASAAVIAGYDYYLCVIPVAVGGSWAGTVRIGGLPVPVASRGGGDDKGGGGGAASTVCRFQFVNGGSPNQRNVQPYTKVTLSLDSQNYYATAGSCPVDTATVSYPVHQLCDSAATTTSTGTCPASSFNTTADSAGP